MVEQLQKKQAELETKNEKLKQEMKELNAKNTEMETESSELKAKNAEIEAENAAKDAQIKALEEQIATLKNQSLQEFKRLRVPHVTGCPEALIKSVLKFIKFLLYSWMYS